MQSTIFAHHFKGLPHFNYFENYPQVPLEEYLGQNGEIECSLVIYDFQGIKKSDTLQPNDVRLYLAIYNLKKNSAYQGPATLEVFCDGKSIHKKHFKSSEEESLYATQEEFNEKGEFELHVTMQGEVPLTVIIPFELSSQRKDWSTWVGSILVLLLAVLAIGARKARVKQDRLSNKQN